MIVEAEPEPEIEASTSELVTAELEAAAVLTAVGVVESYNEESHDIEHLIDKAFDAKCKDDYILAIKIFEQILKQRPPEAIIQLITEDIEVMHKKIS